MMIDLEDLDGPLRHYRVTLAHGWYVFEHRASGAVVRLNATDVHDAYSDQLGLLLPDPGHLVVNGLLELFVSLMPTLCHGCGCPHQAGLCEPCRTRRIVTLKRIAGLSA